MRSAICFAVLSLAAAVNEADIPDSMMGTWFPKGSAPTSAILGPTKLFNTFAMSRVDGDVWFSAIPGQIFHVKDGLMQYCFDGVATSPFYLYSADATKVVFCYKKGTRMKTHAKVVSTGELATGCDAARITLELTDGALDLTFEMSPPVKHAWVSLKRWLPAPPVGFYMKQLRGLCDPTHPGPPTLDANDSRADGHAVLASMCPKVSEKRAVAPAKPAEASQGFTGCAQLDGFSKWIKGGVDIKLYYTQPVAHCWPCKITYTVSAKIDEDEYIAVGFKGMAYRAELLFGGERPCYFGMCVDKVDEDRTTGAIVLGYTSSSGTGCLRQMKATQYVGAPSDVQGNPDLSNTQVKRENGRTLLTFSIEQHVGRSPPEIAQFFNFEQFSARVMWAIGKIGSDANCTAAPSFHTKRGVSPLAWFDQNPFCSPIEDSRNKTQSPPIIV